jgi:Lrp/AsnC family transcriptional regulator
MKRLDKLDREILGLLQDDASLSIQQIADRVGLSVNPCWRRITRLETDGVIRGRVALVDPEKIGLALTVFVRIKTNQHSTAWVQGLREAVEAIPQIAECHRIGGDVDYLLKVVVPDVAGYDRVYRELIGRVPNLADVSALFSMERMKNTTRLSVPDITD